MLASIISYLFLAASIVIAYLFYKRQRFYYNENMEKLEKAKNFFLENPTYSIVTRNGDKLIDESGLEGDLLNLVQELNKYMSRNKGTTDFSIIQNKTERFANTIFENASSNLAFPTYMGLMGTFTGVFLGLIGFVFSDFFTGLGLDFGADEEANITRLVYGVLVSMVTSFIGLLFTTRSNKRATEYKRIMDERKNVFYDFIQNELMPVLGMSVVAALTQLKETLLHFHESFDVITTKFERTFNSCTEKFGKEFEKNIVAVGKAADQLGSSIEIVNTNVENQQKLLKELRSDGMIAALDRFIKAGKQFEESSNTVQELDRIRKELSASITSLINVQKDYNGSLVVPKLIAERLNVILERVTTFENSVNTLGESIAQTHMLGNSELSLIQEHLDNIKRKDAIAAEYQETANEELKALFDSETEIIKSLHRQYTSAIEEHGDEFRVLMDKVSEAITQKKREFMQTLQDAFDLTELQTEFAHLKELPDIHKKIGTLNSSVDAFKSAVKEQSDAEIGKLGTIETKLEIIPSAIKEQTEANRTVVENATSKLQEHISSVSSSTANSIEERSSAILSEVDEVKSSVKTVISNTSDVRKLIEDRLVDVTGKLSSQNIILEELQEYAKQKVTIDKDSMLNIANAIKQQQNEVSVLENMLDNFKEGVNDAFTKMIDSKLKDVSDKVDAINSMLEKAKQNTTQPEKNKDKADKK